MYDKKFSMHLERICLRMIAKLIFDGQKKSPLASDTQCPILLQYMLVKK